MTSDDILALQEGKWYSRSFIMLLVALHRPAPGHMLVVKSDGIVLSTLSAETHTAAVIQYVDRLAHWTLIVFKAPESGPRRVRIYDT